MAEDTPRVWIGCLGCYNAGTLTGEWFDAVDCPTEIDDFDERLGFDEAAAARNIAEKGIVINGVPFSQDHGHPVYGPHEELWVMDHENFGGFLTGECSPVTAQEIAEQMQRLVEEHHVDLEAFGLFIGYYGSIEDWDDAREAFESRYAGKHETPLDFAYHWLEETSFFEDVPERVMAHEDAIVKAWLSSAENGGQISFERAADGNVHAFWNG